MKRIIPEILTKKILHLFFENRKKTFNLKQIKFFIGNVLDIKLLKPILYEFVKYGYLSNAGNDKFRLSKSFKFFKGRINKRAVIDLETGIEFKPRRYELKGLFEGELVYYYINKREQIRVLTFYNREQIKLVGKVINEGKNQYVKIPKKEYRVFIDDRKNYENEIVVVKIKDWLYEDPYGEVVKSLGDENENETQIHAILEEFSLPYVFPKEVLKEAEKIKIEYDKKEREDYKKELTFTIDPVDAKDFDDAISFKKENNEIEVGIHIADVSHFVEKNSVIDKEAIKRATSVYLSDRVVPMLPEKLSNDVCSLNPNEDKLVFSVYVSFDNNFNIKRSRISKSLINSNERFSYAEAQHIIENKNGIIPKESTILKKEKKVSKELVDSIITLNSIAENLKNKRKNNGSIFFSKEEVRFKVNEKGEPVDFMIKKQKKANFLIEEFMLLANVTVAEKIIESKRKGVFRIHDKPDEKKIAEIERFVKNIGYNINIINSKEPNKEINKLLALAEKKPEKNVLDMMVIRAMSKAKYSTQNIGHFGLMFENYTHFTSPIRRYPDLIVHRIINEILNKEKSTQSDLENTCLHCSSMEEKATKAERASTKLMQVKYLQDKTDEVFKGVISGMNERGVFVEINDSKCEGLVKMKDIPNDFYNFDKRTNTVIGQNTLQEYVLGDSVFVKVQKTNIEKKQIDFKIIED
jgi:ribonuclease R